MSFKEKLLDFIQSELDKIDCNQLWDNVYLNFLVDKNMLINGYELVYYKKLIEKGKQDTKIIDYLCNLRDNSAQPSQTTYLYYIYYLERLINNKKDSQDNLLLTTLYI